MYILKSLLKALIVVCSLELVTESTSACCHCNLVLELFRLLINFDASDGASYFSSGFNRHELVLL